MQGFFAQCNTSSPSTCICMHKDACTEKHPQFRKPVCTCLAAAMQTMQTHSTRQAAALLLKSQVLAAGGARMSMLDMCGPLDTSLSQD